MSQRAWRAFVLACSSNQRIGVRVPFHFPVIGPAEMSLNNRIGAGTSQRVRNSRGLALALYDYLRQSRRVGIRFSLAGGAGFSAVACLVSLIVDLAFRKLGRAG